jgi:hypothetical protein
MMGQAQIIRRMGFVRDQEGIMKRYICESTRWQAHLERTRNFISGSFMHSEAETVAVLGSGWLLDVPLDHLVNRFKQIYLVDIHHPIQIRKKTGSMSRVELIEEDLSGGAVEQIWNYLRKNRAAPDQQWPANLISLEPPLSGIDPDAIISCNLMNQLDIFLCDYILKRGSFQHDSLIPFRAAIQAFHLEWISKKPGCLVTDTVEEVVDRKDRKTSRTLLYTELPTGIRHDSWRWEFDTTGTYHHGSRTNMEVRAVEWK